MRCLLVIRFVVRSAGLPSSPWPNQIGDGQVTGTPSSHIILEPPALRKGQITNAKRHFAFVHPSLPGPQWSPLCVLPLPYRQGTTETSRPQRAQGVDHNLAFSRGKHHDASPAPLHALAAHPSALGGPQGTAREAPALLRASGKETGPSARFSAQHGLNRTPRLAAPAGSCEH
jgi:hypothetical protein